jgi:mRNA-degrading endonuclease RelE of RelBE toxin-antitoxin system
MPTYNIEYDAAAADELRAIRRHDQVAIIDAIERHLTKRPAHVSRSKIKRLDPPVLATYRLRAGDYRVFYDIDEVARVVRIVAVRFKGRGTLQEAADAPSD